MSILFFQTLLLQASVIKKLDQVFKEFGLNSTIILNALAGKGIKADPSLTIKEIAKKNKIEPITLFEIDKGRS